MASISFKANVGKVQDVKFSQDGKARLQFSAAEGHRGKVNGEWADTGTTWYSVTVWGKDAEDLADVLRDGAKQRVIVSGRLSSRKYQASDGSERESLDVSAEFVGVAPTHNAQQGGQGASQQWTPQAAAPAVDPWGAPSNANTGWGATDTDAPF